jgi:hypothetical protein
MTISKPGGGNRLNKGSLLLLTICVCVGIFTYERGTGLFFPLLPVSAAAATPSPEPDVPTADPSPIPGSHGSEEAEPAPPASFALSWDVTLASNYIFQGIDYSDGEPVVQPEVILSAKDFSAIFWFNHDLHTHDSNEFDFYLQHDWQIQDLSLTAGYARYDYPTRDGWDPSQEIYADLSYSAPMNPSVSIHYDFDAGKGSYTTLGISREKETLFGTSSLEINLFYQNHYYGTTGFPAMEFKGSTGYPIGSFTVTPSLSYYMTWDNGDFQGDTALPDPWLYSINISQSF